MEFISSSLKNNTLGRWDGPVYPCTLAEVGKSELSVHWGGGEGMVRRNDKETGSTGLITGRIVGRVKGKRIPEGFQVEVCVLAWALRG